MVSEAQERMAIEHAARSTYEARPGNSAPDAWHRAQKEVRDLYLRDAERAFDTFRPLLLLAEEAPQPSSNEERLREALQGFLDTWLNCDRKLTEADWEEMDEAERDARAALQEETP